MKNKVAVIAFLALSYCTTFAQDTPEQTAPVTIQVTPEYRAAAMQLFKSLTPDDPYQGMVNGILKRIERYDLGMSKDFQDSLAKSFDNTAYYNDQIQVYAEVFNIDEIKELIKFNESPVSKKMRRYANGFMIKLGGIEEQYFSIICQELAKKLEARGFEAPAFLKPPPDIPVNEEIKPEIK